MRATLSSIPAVSWSSFTTYVLQFRHRSFLTAVAHEVATAQLSVLAGCVKTG